MLWNGIKEKTKSSCRYDCFVFTQYSEGNSLYTQSLAPSWIWTQLPYGHELCIILNFSRNVKNRYCFWKESSFPEEKYYTYPYVHTQGCPGKNAHYSDTASEQTAPLCLLLRNRGAQARQAHTLRHHCRLQYSPAFTWACPSDLLCNTNKASQSSSHAEQQQNLPFLPP